MHLKVTTLRRFVFFFIHICRYQTWSSLNDIVYFIIYLYIPCRLYPKGPITRFHILYFNRHIRTTTFNIRTLYSCSKLNFELRRGLRVTISYFIWSAMVDFIDPSRKVYFKFSNFCMRINPLNFIETSICLLCRHLREWDHYRYRCIIYVPLI